MRNPIILSAPLTFGDWVLHKDNPPFSPEGIRIALERCRAYGFTRIYWRCYGAGRAAYTSSLVDPIKDSVVEQENMYNDEALGSIFAMDDETRAKCNAIDFGRFDSLQCAIDSGHELGLEIHAWASINEDDHGAGWPSRFAKQHPEFHWVNRDGRVYRSQLSFAYERVRQYKLELVKEMLAYDIDGLFLDWVRTGDIRDNPQADDDGVADYGYEEPNILEFRRRYGVDAHCVPNADPRWVAVRAEPITEFMRQCRKLVSANGRKIPISVMGHNLWGYRGVLPGMDGYEKYKDMGGNRINGSLLGLLCDIAAWAGEGLADEAVLAGYYYGGGSSAEAYCELVRETKGKLNPWTYEWVPQKAADMENCLKTAEAEGAGQILFWEADYVDNMPKEDLDEIRKLVRDARAMGRIR